MSDTDVPIAARIYNSTLQRVQCDLRQFNSHAAFILACENIRKIYVWVGKKSNADDVALAESVAFDILREDYLNIGELETIKEDQEPGQSLDIMLGQLFMKIDDYRQQAPYRANKIENSPVTLSIIERLGENEYALKSVAYSAANRTGAVPMLPFLSVVDRKTIAVLTTGGLYDIWFAEAVSRREKVAVKAFIIETAMAKVPSKQRGLESVVFDRSLCLVGQDRPTALFRANFTSNTRYLATSNMKTRPSIAKKSLNATKGSNQKCSDCVGDAILRLLGISSKPSAGSSSSSEDMSSTRSELDDDTKSTASHGSSLFCSTEALSSAFSGSSASTSSTTSRGGLSHSDSSVGSGKDSIYLKVQRLIGRTDIQFINPPRRNTNLLVLDLDHTLMDFSCRFDYMAEQLKRPYLDAFLAKTYVYYDIVVWSQTNFKWLELKLTELGMLNRRDYKICFALVGIPVLLPSPPPLAPGASTHVHTDNPSTLHVPQFIQIFTHLCPLDRWQFLRLISSSFLLSAGLYIYSVCRAPTGQVHYAHRETAVRQTPRDYMVKMQQPGVGSAQHHPRGRPRTKLRAEQALRGADLSFPFETGPERHRQRGKFFSGGWHEHVGRNDPAHPPQRVSTAALLRNGHPDEWPRSCPPSGQGEQQFETGHQQRV